MANIDRADWHYGGDYPADLPHENAGTHIGMYLAWVIQSGLASKKLLKYVAPKLDAFSSRQMTGRDLLFSDLDEKFFDQLLTPEGKEFTRAYYESNDYFNDYAEALAANFVSVYEVADTWENYDILAPILNGRLHAWRQSRMM